MWKPSKAKQQRETEDKQKSQGMRDSDRLNGKKWADLNRRTSAMTAANPNKKRRWRQLHSWMIIITVVALSSSLFAYHEFSRGGSTFRQTWIQHPLYPNQTNQPASQQHTLHRIYVVWIIEIYVRLWQIVLESWIFVQKASRHFIPVHIAHSHTHTQTLSHSFEPAHISVACDTLLRKT